MQIGELQAVVSIISKQMKVQIDSLSIKQIMVSLERNDDYKMEL
jgi:hypothetical protein